MRKADEVIKAFIPMLNSQEGNQYFDLFSSWASILGEDLIDISAHTEPVDVKNGALIVYVDHPGWMQKLEFQKKKILYRLKKRYPQLGLNSIFVQRVNNERFVERREARLLGARQANGGQAHPQRDSGLQEQKNYSSSAEHDEISKEHDSSTDSSVREKLPEDSELAQTFRRLESLSRKAKKQ